VPRRLRGAGEHMLRVTRPGGVLLLTAELPCEIVHAQSHHHEFAVVLRARPAA
jgi:hypothetical protein